MNKYNLYFKYKIADKEFTSSLNLSSKYKMKDINIGDAYKIVDGELRTKIQFLPDQSVKGINDMKLREKFNGLSPIDQERVLKNGIVKKDEVEYDNMDLFFDLTIK